MLSVTVIVVINNQAYSYDRPITTTHLPYNCPILSVFYKFLSYYFLIEL